MKYIRTHIKQEKRILKLMYKKGIFDLLRVDIKRLGWEFLLEGRKGRRRKGEYSFSDYLPQLHSYTCDYWGEWDSDSIISNYQEYLFWTTGSEFTDMGYPEDGLILNRHQLIKYLKALPIKRNDSKFNSILKITKY